jgi:transcriptional regulator with XRE-family HTH domain
MNWSEYRKKLLSDPDVKIEYDKLAGEYDLARSIIDQRLRQKMTQSDLAKKIGTQQPSIARLESPHYGRASISMLEKVAQALNARLVIKLEPIANPVEDK